MKTKYLSENIEKIDEMLTFIKNNKHLVDSERLQAMEAIMKIYQVNDKYYPNFDTLLINIIKSIYNDIKNKNDC